MTYPRRDVDLAERLLRDGWSVSAAASAVGTTRSTIRYWRANGFSSGRKQLQVDCAGGSTCAYRAVVPAHLYAYLLGLYLGDGNISLMARGVYRLRLTLDLTYPGIIDEGETAMRAVLPNEVSRVKRAGCLDLCSYSKHWPCLFPQHGLGMKHQRKIELAPWQVAIALELWPKALLRGLIHSDGCRVLNRVKGTDYPRYFFSNGSSDIRTMFVDACDRLDIRWTANKRYDISVSAPSVRAKARQLYWPQAMRTITRFWCPERDLNPHALSGNGF